eukprot:XP_017445449.1 PREDICTED: NACHT, LRR and PYD domains-containing protein 5-like [Rattus norvegicus]
MTPPRKDDEAIPKDEGSEKEQTTETKMTPPEKDAEMVTKVKGPEQEQTTESPTTPPKKDDKATPKEEGSEEEQKPPGLQEGWAVKMVTPTATCCVGFCQVS